MSRYQNTWVHVTLVYLLLSPVCKSRDAGSWGTQKRGHEVQSLYKSVDVRDSKNRKTVNLSCWHLCMKGSSFCEINREKNSMLVLCNKNTDMIQHWLLVKDGWNTWSVFACLEKHILCIGFHTVHFQASTQIRRILPADRPSLLCWPHNWVHTSVAFYISLSLDWTVSITVVLGFPYPFPTFV